jgi:hypothetical protein
MSRKDSAVVFLLDLITALLIATFLVAVIGLGFRRRRLDAAPAAVFVMIFLATWAGGVWLAPIGPAIWGLDILSFVIVGVLIALLLTAVMPRRPPRTRGEALRQEDSRRQAARTANVFFWILIVSLAAGILLRYIVGAGVR